MESNREESYNCIRRAKSYLREGNVTAAEKFAKKAKRLFPSRESEELLLKIESYHYQSKPDVNLNQENKTNKNHEQWKMNGESSRLNPKESSKSNLQQEQRKQYTSEQLKIVTQIRKCKDYYQLLGVHNLVSEVDLKKSYRKLALQCHPDKNHAPGATEAFKAIGNAYAVLSDPRKKWDYDLASLKNNRTSSSYHFQTKNDYTHYTREQYTRSMSFKRH